MSIKFDKTLKAVAKEWKSGRVSNTVTSKVDLSTNEGYQKYMAIKYEMLCESLNKFNINK